MTRPSSATPLSRARSDDSARRRRRVLRALDELVSDGQAISVSAVARHAGVHRSLIYRHADLHALVITRAEQPPDAPSGPQVSRQSLLADLANLSDRNARLAGHNALLERRLSEALGEQVWRESGLGGPVDIHALQEQVQLLEQENADLRGKLADHTEDLDAARAANRELMTELNSTRPRR